MGRWHPTRVSWRARARSVSPSIKQSVTWGIHVQILTRKRPCAAKHGDAVLQFAATAAAGEADLRAADWDGLSAGRPAQPTTESKTRRTTRRRGSSGSLTKRVIQSGPQLAWVLPARFGGRGFASTRWLTVTPSPTVRPAGLWTAAFRLKQIRPGRAAAGVPVGYWGHAGALAPVPRHYIMMAPGIL